MTTLNNVFSTLFFTGGSILVWGEILSTILGMALILYSIYRFNKRLSVLHTRD